MSNKCTMTTLLYSQLKRPRDNLLFGKYYHSAKESKVNGSWRGKKKKNTILFTLQQKKIP